MPAALESLRLCPHRVCQPLTKTGVGILLTLVLRDIHGPKSWAARQRLKPSRFTLSLIAISCQINRGAGANRVTQLFDLPDHSTSPLRSAFLRCF